MHQIYLKAAFTWKQRWRRTLQRGCGNNGFCRDSVHQIYLKTAFTWKQQLFNRAAGTAAFAKTRCTKFIWKQRLRESRNFSTGLREQRLLQRLGAPSLFESSIYVKAATFQQGCGNSGFCRDLVGSRAGKLSYARIRCEAFRRRYARKSII